MAKYLEKNLEDWNVSDFHAYMIDKHIEMFGISYQPFINWGAEKGLLGRFVGTAKKKGEVSKEVAKEFIDIIFRDHKPTRKYPGVNFGSNYTHRKFLIQQAGYEVNERKEREAKQLQEERNATSYEDLAKLL